MELNYPNEVLLTSGYIWKRRQNLGGCEITSAYIDEEAGMYEINPTDNCSKRIKGTNKIVCLADKWSNSLVHELIRELNITLFFKKAEDKQYGIKLEETENWTGLIGLLQQKGADLTFNSLTFTASRKIHTALTHH